MFYIGISLEKDLFKVAILKREKSGIAVDSLHSFPYGPDNVKLFYNLPPFHAGAEVKIVSGLSVSDVFIRKLHIPLSEKSKILATLPFQLESLLPFTDKNPIICPLFKPMGKQMTCVTVIAAPEETLTSHLEALKGIDIEPQTVSCGPTALMRFAQWKAPTASKILCFDVHDQKISCVVSEGSEILLSQTLILSDDVQVEIEKLAVFLKQKGVIDDETPWILSGSTDIAEFLKRFFLGQRLLENDEALLPFAVPIGLALDAMAGDECSIQFCQNLFTPISTLKTRKKWALSYLSLCLAALLALTVGGTLIVGKKKRLLVETLESYLPGSVAKGSLSSPGDIQNKLTEWESSLKGQKNPFTYLPSVPKVSDVLAWISTHPSFASTEGDQKEGIELNSLHYSLVKYPKIGEPTSAYNATVELEFTSATPRHSRDFHEALLKGDQIVNSKKEVKWQTHNQTTHAAFELAKGAG